ncbi:hypothetical protein HN51_006623 [Arachis hypogaea]
MSLSHLQASPNGESRVPTPSQLVFTSAQLITYFHMFRMRDPSSSPSPLPNQIWPTALLLSQTTLLN